MTRKNLILAGGALLLVGALLGWVGKGLAAGEAALPGSEQDPLVSRSYVDQKVDEAINQKVAQELAMVVVEVPAGKQIICSAGTEVIVRGGTATVIDTQMGGLADVTGGKDLRKGEQAPANHLLIVPRDDGRGLKATTALILMVRGSYSIQ